MTKFKKSIVKSLGMKSFMKFDSACNKIKPILDVFGAKKGV